MHRELIIKTGPWNTKLTYNDDSEFFIRLALSAEKIIFVNDAISYYRKGNAFSVSHRKDKKALQSRLLCLNLSSEHILRTKDNTEIRKIIATEYAKFVFSVYPSQKKLRRSAQEKIKLLGVTPVKNFFNVNRPSGKISKLVGWKAVKLIQYLIN